MPDLLDLFDEPEQPKISPTQAPQGAQATTLAVSAEEAARLPCSRPYISGTHRCWVGGGVAVFSCDDGANYACPVHVPPGFPGRRLGTT